MVDNSMAHILSLKEVEDYFCMTMDTNEDHAMLVYFKKVRHTVSRSVETPSINLTSMTQKLYH